MRYSKEELFLKESFKGSGKYYLLERGSRRYRDTLFTQFYYKNRKCIDIIQRGNDAPRGGMTGYYVIVKFNDEFTKKWGSVVEKIKQDKRELHEAKVARQKEIKALGNQSKRLKQIFKDDPEFLEMIRNRIENYSSKKWRNWVRLKVCKKIANSRFDLLTLSPADIREIAFRS